MFAECLAAVVICAAPQPFEAGLPDGGSAFGRVSIPAIGVDVRMIQGTNQRILTRGAGHLRSTWMPGQEGTVALFAHRVTPTLGKAHGPFYDLDKLRRGQRVITSTSYGRTVYRVRRTFIIDNQNWHAVRARRGTMRLLLLACHPKGSAAKRIVVEATA